MNEFWGILLRAPITKPSRLFYPWLAPPTRLFVGGCKGPENMAESCAVQWGGGVNNQPGGLNQEQTSGNSLFLNAQTQRIKVAAPTQIVVQILLLLIQLCQ